MVAGWHRLNEKRSQPNPNIVFIKPLKGPDEKIAQDFLERIAAQCRPIMKEHHLYVTSLEEYEPNREFVGRNFNAGEVVQLVLKSPHTGRWLPFDYVQMVMMHELAHCKQMNHSRAFWAVRNAYAAQMQTLWSKGYTGDGIWGRGTNLATGEWEKNTVLADEILPEHLCGGTYRSRGTKRRAKPTLTYQERKERRTLKKFGKNGQVLGADESTKVKLEKGKKVQGKPRVAGSARGRELRAAAVLARFENQREEATTIKGEDEETDSDSDSDEVVEVDGDDVVDINGRKLVDAKGRGLVKVCEDEDADDPGAQDEAQMLQGMVRRWIKRESPDVQILDGFEDFGSRTATARVKEERKDGPSSVKIPVKSTTPNNIGSPKAREPSSTSGLGRGKAPPTASNSSQQTFSASSKPCSMCSFANPPLAPTCNMCANVLDPTVVSWRCRSDSCRDSSYRNSKDCGVCGLCGKRRGGSD